MESTLLLDRPVVFWWLVGAASVALFVLLLFKSFEGVCRTPMETIKLLARISSTVCATLLHYVQRGFQPKFPNWTLRFELAQGIARCTMDMYGDRIVEERHAPLLRRQSELIGTFMGWIACQQLGMRVESVHFNGLEHLWLRSSSNANANRLVLLYYHGGAYAILSPRAYISYCCKLVDAIKKEFSKRNTNEEVVVEAFLANYRKIPECQFPVPAEDAVAMYEYLLQHEGLMPSQIIVAGDSAGGGLVLSTLLRVRDGMTSSKVELPLAAIVSSPVTDLSLDEDVDGAPNCIISSKLTSACIHNYHPTHGDPSTWADASPVHCNLQGLPPVLVQAGACEYIFQHSVRLVEKAKADGVTNMELDAHENMPHVFTFFPTYVLPYARVGFQRMAIFAVTQKLRQGKRIGHVEQVSTDAVRKRTSVVVPKVSSSGA